LPELVRHDVHVDTSREKNVKSFPRSGNVENPERPASPLGSEYEVILLTFPKNLYQMKIFSIIIQQVMLV
jgi:hypothetical protein